MAENPYAEVTRHGETPDRTPLRSISHHSIMTEDMTE